MRLKTKVLVVAVPVAVAAVAGVVVVAKVRQRRRRGRVLPTEVRTSMEELLRLKGDDFVPDGLGTSLYHRKLASLTDRQLVGIYALAKVAEALEGRGWDVRSLSKDQLREAQGELKAAMESEQGRKDLLRELEGLGVDTLHGILKDGALLAGV